MRLSSAGRRALGRGDLPAGANLLRRAVGTLSPGDIARLELLPDLGEALTELGRFEDAAAALTEALADGVEPRIAAHARLVSLYLHLYAADMPDWAAEVEVEVERCMPIFRGAGDEAGLALAHRLLFVMHATLGRYGQAAQAAEAVSKHARVAHDARQQHRGASNYAQVALHSPLAVPLVIERAEALLHDISGDRGTEATIRGALGWLYAMRGDFARARDETAMSRSWLQELGKSVLAASTSLNSAAVELLAGDAEAAETQLRRDYEDLSVLGERYVLSTVAGLLSQVTFARGAFEEADSFALICEELAADDDVASQALWRGTRAKLMARAGQVDEAVELARATLELVRASEAPLMQAEALRDLAAVLASSGRADQAGAALAEARELYELKGDIVSAARLGSQLTAESDIGQPLRM
jgi:tetratricopeptide (TPR) repeat protein